MAVAMERRLRWVVLVSLAILAAGCTQAFPGQDGASEPNAWALEMTQVDALHERGLTGAGVDVAVVDTGVGAGHEEFQGVTVTWRDFVNDRSDPYDDHGHGTHVSGLAVGQGAGGIGNPKVLGSAPGADLVHAKAIKGSGEGGSSSDVADAIDWSVRQGAEVLVLSLGQRPGLLNLGNQVGNAAKDAVDAGVIVVAAAGNADRGESGDSCDVQSPGTVKGVIAVGAVGPDGRIARFSCGQEGGDGTLGLGSNEDPHKKPEVSAPGVQLVGPWPGRSCAGRTADYCVLNGTSQATPIVGGIAALILEENPNLARQDRQTVFHVKEAFAQTAREVGFDGHHHRYGYGIVQAEEALRWIENNDVDSSNDGGLPPIPPG